MYSLLKTPLGGSSVTVKFGCPLGDGVFAVAYDQGKGQSFTMPFTESGLTHDGHKVPETGMLTLIGTGLLGLGFFGRRKFRK